MRGVNVRVLSRLFTLAAVAWAVVPAPAADAPALVPTELSDYVTKPDQSFEWKLLKKAEAPAGIVYTLKMVSQTWQGVTWDHDLQVFLPAGTAPQRTMLVYNTGGSANAGNAALGTAIAAKVNAPIAFLYGVPKQPLFGGKKEDALIAETFVRYLETEDPSWPLLFPMAKSLVKAMDALQAFAKQEWKYDVTHFIVTGASKRGWTSWLTAASGDPRVKAIAPMVIDTLNMPVQMGNQVKAFGKPSEMIHDYVERKLVPVPQTSVAQKLWKMIDPWVYREKLTLPKLLIHGTNDPYWPQDALNSYWDDLKGEKYVLYVPNAGHGLQEEVNGRREPIPTRAVNTLAAFARSQIFDKPLPRLAWKYTDGTDGTAVRVESDLPSKLHRHWVAESDSRDFRKAVWTSTEHKGGEPCVAATPANGKYRATFVEAVYELDGQPFSLSTQIRILEPKK